MLIRRATREDMPQWLRLRSALWPAHDEEDWPEEILSMLHNQRRRATFVAEQDGVLVGFLEASLRDYAPKCQSSPVGFVEGWYVEKKNRKSGIGRALVKAAERWAIDKGCTEMASDALIRNTRSHRAHKALGYEEVERQVCFRKALRSL